MAKIGKFEFRIESNEPKDYPVYYTQANKFEIRGISEEFFNVTGISNCGYLTEIALNKAIHEAIPLYHESKKRQRLVIGYRCKATSELRMNKVDEGRYRGTMKGVSDKIMSFDAFTAPLLSIGIDYEVWMEIFNGKENEYYPVDKDHKVSSSFKINFQRREGMTFIEYTEENYEFFQNIGKGMQEMVKKLSLFFDMNAEDAQQLIASNQKLIG